MFYCVREVRRGRQDLFDVIRPDRPPEIGIDTLVCCKIEMHRHITARKPVFPLGVFPQIAINHLHHDLEMKRYHQARVSKKLKGELRLDHTGRA
jgi:hypothetical protein